ncbi:MAG: ATP-binding protein [Hominimerdicola sp.]
MFFIVMGISAIISITILFLVFSPIMKESSKQQLTSTANSINKLAGNSGYTADEIIYLVNNSSFSVINLDKYDDYVLDNNLELNEKGYCIIDEDSILPNIIMIVKIYDKYYKMDSLSRDNMYTIMLLVIIVAFVACVLIGTIITSFVGKTIMRPIRELSRATSEVARGNFSVRVRIPNDKDFSILARNFNKMAEELSGIETLRGDFISSVSHEFKTPLASIQGFAKLLQDENLSKEDQQEYTQIIIDETNRLTKMSGNILKLTKLENQTSVGKKVRFSLDEQIRNIILILEPEWSKKNINLDIELEDITYIGNAELMGQVWQNVINNAIKFTPEGGEIKVQLYRGEMGIVAKISDSGPGISKEAQDKIFEKFYQGDQSRATEGNGLGLALVKKILDLCNGKISVENLYEGGACFKIELPYIIQDMK